MCSKKVADLSEFWHEQKYIDLLDANLLACKERIYLLCQLSESKAYVDFTQGLDARFITDEVAIALKSVKKKSVHFAFDFMKNEKAIIKGLNTYRKFNTRTEHDIVYILTNFNTTIEEDLYRIQMVKDAGFYPDVRVYRKPTAPKIIKDLQRWCNNRILFKSTSFMDYVPRADGKTIKEIYFGGKNR